MRTQIRLFALIFFFFIPAAYASAQECLSYDNDKVGLPGTISKETFPGPPNYESVEKGDQPETYWILHLTIPICTTASGDNDAEKDVTDVQLILTQKQYELVEKLSGEKSLVFFGRLSHAISGHHHTSVLMEVKQVGIRGGVKYVPAPPPAPQE